MKKLSSTGIAVAGIVWLALVFALSGEAACLPRACDRGDLILAGIAGAAMVAPAYFATRMLASVFPRLNDPGDPSR
ncbi:hypothetical protein QRO08_09615 [Paracidovorax citrulli]|uniref:Lipoprotein n=1 Tax=Paracidovorax citrulli TaxID=80869 RepID=A0ABY9AVH0_PARCI|nr:hypothetical protein [Paracidovorax citrulli]MVT36802.1 hypothetical protein [Paracidovorax citrulli]WIY40448.1 hypothetical protein QRO10_05765 [Paracidovorax citrulli]WIY42316.1 hypothetical protein QRO12_15255 [Paracidovorax citrulli]WIY50795.1 hypothetical protein QRO08_09615 [Paracidovorax citrulli]